jgi:hypothetical protein
MNKRINIVNTPTINSKKIPSQMVKSFLLFSADICTVIAGTQVTISCLANTFLSRMPVISINGIKKERNV